MQVSILDQCPIAAGATATQAIDATIELARAADRWG